MARHLLPALFLLLAACGEDSTAPEPLANGFMTAVLDGARWEATVAVAAVRSGNTIGFSGVAADQSVIGLGFTNSGVGTYTIATSPGLVASVTSLVESRAWGAASYAPPITSLGSGTLTIATLDATRVAGTFSFTAPPSPGSGASGTRTVTQGVFDIRF